MELNKIKKQKKKSFCLEPGLNQRPLDLQSDALPAELSRHCCKFFYIFPYDT